MAAAPGLAGRRPVSTADLVVEIVTSPDDEVLEALSRLVPQLSANPEPVDRQWLEEMVTAPGTSLFVAREPDGSRRIVGTLSLVVYRVPTGRHALIEDVVVDEQARGSGAGALLVAAALRHAVDLGAGHVDLTSRPSREAANRLYERAGMQRRETNAYRFRAGSQLPGHALGS